MAHRVLSRAVLAAALSVAVAGAAEAGPGDIYKVTGEKVNLRAGPSDQSAVRAQVLQGDELIELAQQGRWLGVRVVRTGEEGWIFSDLVRRTAQSSLGRRASPAGFGRYSRDFDSLIEAINGELGYPMVAAVDQGPNNTLRVTPTSEWMLNTGRDAKLYAALALYQMWKAASGGRPSNVALMLNGTPYLGVGDSNAGPLFTMEPPPANAFSGSAR